MLTSVKIRHFQSLNEVDMELAPFTVVVGPSSSGKSAFVRSLRLVAANSRGTSYITQGFTDASVSVDTDDGHSVTIRRSAKPSGKNQYEVDGETYSKLGGAVPEAVSDALGIPAPPDLHIAGQFDSPYLLGSSAADNARTLGSLTNVEVIFEAARESNRRKLSSSGTLNTRNSDVDRLKSEIASFDGLEGREHAVERAETALSASRESSEARTHLESILGRLEGVQRVLDETEGISTASVPDIRTVDVLYQSLDDARSALARLESAVRSLDAANKSADVVIPDLDVSGIDTLESLKVALSRLTALSKSLKSGQESLDASDAKIAEAENEYHNLLDEAGVCPTCGQKVGA